MTDLQERLRQSAGHPDTSDDAVDLIRETIDQLDALTAERDELQHRNEVEVASRKELQRLLGNAQAERDALKRHYDGAGPEHNLLALLDLYNDRRGEADNAAANARDEAAALRAQLATALQQCANGAAKLAAIESLPRCGLVTSQMGGLLIAERPDGAWVSYEKLRAALATPSATVIRPCPHCGKEGEADAAETELTCPYCGYDWSVPATPSAHGVPRCSNCGCFSTSHEVDDEERRECTECECRQYLVPPFGRPQFEPHKLPPSQRCDHGKLPGEGCAYCLAYPKEPGATLCTCPEEHETHLVGCPLNCGHPDCSSCDAATLAERSKVE
jgi:hypothetical protein